jgi:hypothetical protein
MKRVVFISIFLIVCPVLAQDEKADLKTGARVNPDKPTVYLEYACQNKKRAYLRMHNNTIWNVLVRTDELYYEVRKPIELSYGVKSHALANNREISLQYHIEPFSMNPQKVDMPKITYPHVHFAGWIASNDSIQFSVPMAYLREDLQVVVNFQYEWEVVKPTYLNDPEHRITFRGIDLPVASGANCPANSPRSER